MIISAHQPAFIPWLGYFHKIAVSDVFVIMDDVQFEKNSFTNRNKILNNGKELWLTIPVKTKNHLEKRLYEIEVADHLWKKKQLRTVEQNYKGYPFYKEVFPLLERMYHIESNFLVDYTNAFLFEVLEYVGIDTKIVKASELNIVGKKLDYVVELTTKLGGNVFVFGKQGIDYADVDYMKNKNVYSYFQDYTHPVYTQNANEFVSHLSIVDLLFKCGPDSKKVILSGNINRAELHKMLSKQDFV